MRRDFTYIYDIIQGCLAAIDRPTQHEIFNLGNNQPEELITLIQILEKVLGKKAIIEFQHMQPGDVLETCADLTKSQALLNYTPKTSLEKGIHAFATWYEAFFN